MAQMGCLTSAKQFAQPRLSNLGQHRSGNASHLGIRDVTDRVRRSDVVMLHRSHGVLSWGLLSRKFIMTRRIWTSALCLSTCCKRTSTSKSWALISVQSCQWHRVRATSHVSSQHARATSSKTWHPSHGINFGTVGGNNRVVQSSFTSTSSTIHSKSGTTRNIQGLSIAVANTIAERSDTHGHAESLIVLAGPTSQAKCVGLSSAGTSSIYDKTYPQQPESSSTSRHFTSQSSTAFHDIAESEEVLRKLCLHKDEGRTRTFREELNFRIPAQLLEATKKLGPNHLEGYWSHTLYEGRDGLKVEVKYCKTKEESETVLASHFIDKAILGFDIEWKIEPRRGAGIKAIKENVSLVQLASEECIALFHIALFPEDNVENLVPPSLKRLMEDSGVEKAGVNIKGDCTRIRNNLGINCQGLIELSHLYKLVKYSPNGSDSTAEGNPALINRRTVSLAMQAEEHLGLPLYKGDSVRGSDWSVALGPQQVKYAASDSYAGFMLHDVLERKRLALDPVPPRPYHAELGRPIRLAAGIEIPTIDENITDDTEDPPPPPPRRRLAKDSANRDFINSPSYIAADAWARNHRSIVPSTPAQTRARESATQSQLRAYALWRESPTLSCRSLADALGVKEGTVAMYICEAVRLERLPYEPAQLNSVLASVPESMRATWPVRAVAKLVGKG